MPQDPALVPILPRAVAEGVTCREAAMRMRALDEIATDDFRIVPELVDQRRPLPEVTPEFLQASHAGLAEVLERAGTRNPTEARLYQAKRAAHAKLTRKLSAPGAFGMGVLGYFAAASEDIALALASDGSQRGRRYAREILGVAIAIHDRGVLAARHRAPELLATEIAAQTGQGLSRTVIDLHRDGRIADDDPRRGLSQADLRSHPVFQADAGDVIVKASSLIAAARKRAQPDDGAVWSREAIEADIAAFQQEAQLYKTLYETGPKPRKAEAMAGMMRYIGRASERAALNLFQERTEESRREARDLLSVGAASAERSSGYLAQARAGQPPRARSRDMVH